MNEVEVVETVADIGGFPVDRNTPLVDLKTLEYPIYIRDLNGRLESPASFGPTVNSEVLRSFGYAPVETTAIPKADVVVEGEPELVDGVWKRTWVTREHTPEERSAEITNELDRALEAIERLRESQFGVGFPYLFNNGEVYHVQVRDGDRANILSKRTRAKEALEEGRKDYTVDFQVYENVAVTLSAEEMVAMSNEADDQVTKAYGVIWRLKATAKKATSVEEFPALPETIFE